MIFNINTCPTLYISVLYIFSDIGMNIKTERKL